MTYERTTKDGFTFKAIKTPVGVTIFLNGKRWNESAGTIDLATRMIDAVVERSDHILSLEEKHGKRFRQDTYGGRLSSCDGSINISEDELPPAFSLPF